MTAVPLQVEPVAHAERLRRLCFVLLTVGSTVCGALLGLGWSADVVWLAYPAYVGWIANDLRVRGVPFGFAAIQLLLALLPGWGLLVYLLVSRRLAALLQFPLLYAAIIIPAAFAGILSHAIQAAATGGRW